MIEDDFSIIRIVYFKNFVGCISNVYFILSQVLFESPFICLQLCVFPWLNFGHSTSRSLFKILRIIKREREREREQTVFFLHAAELVVQKTKASSVYGNTVYHN